MKMKTNPRIAIASGRLAGLLLACLMIFPALPVQAGEPPHKVVIHVSSGDQATQNLALVNAANIQKHYGKKNVAIEIVTYGPGLALVTNSGSQVERVKQLSAQNVRFSACANTMRSVEERTGRKPALAGGVRIVPAGVARIIELQEQGYRYLRP